MTSSQKSADSSQWGQELDELAQRRRLAQAMGGQGNLERVHGAGKLNARGRVEAFYA